MNKKPDPKDAKIILGRTLRQVLRELPEKEDGEEDVPPVGIFSQDDDPEADFWVNWNT